MPDKKVIIRVDGNSNIGLGHVYRGIALAEMLKEEYVVEFVTRMDTTISPIKESGFNYTYIPKIIDFSDEPIWIKNNYSTDTIVVLDGYDFKEDYQQKIKNSNFKLVYIDDLAQGTQKADMVINHSPGAKEVDYRHEEYTKFALGLCYALLRKPFISFDRSKIRHRKEIKNVFISFGGADINDLSFATVNEINKLEFIEEINVVIGAAYKHDEIFKLLNSKIKIYKNITSNEVFMIMKKTDLAIVPASTISIELASLGVPMILGYFIDNQKNIYKGFVDKDVVLGVGNFNLFHFENLCKIISSNSDLEFLIETREKLLGLFNSNPKVNYLKLFQFNELVIRRATNSDMKFVFELSNETLVRANSYGSEKIELCNHKNWFEKQLDSTDVLFYIIEKKGKQIGQVKFSIKNDFSVIGISISNKYRGKGFASKSLKLAVDAYFIENNIPIYAYIKTSNIASIKSFENAGFHLFKKEPVNDIESYVYIKRYSEN